MTVTVVGPPSPVLCIAPVSVCGLADFAPSPNDRIAAVPLHCGSFAPRRELACWRTAVRWNRYVHPRRHVSRNLKILFPQSPRRFGAAVGLDSGSAHRWPRCRHGRGRTVAGLDHAAHYDPQSGSSIIRDAANGNIGSHSRRVRADLTVVPFLWVDQGLKGHARQAVPLEPCGRCVPPMSHEIKRLRRGLAAPRLFIAGYALPSVPPSVPPMRCLSFGLRSCSSVVFLHLSTWPNQKQATRKHHRLIATGSMAISRPI